MTLLYARPAVLYSRCSHPKDMLNLVVKDGRSEQLDSVETRQVADWMTVPHGAHQKVRA
jgi:hypothetical protein